MPDSSGAVDRAAAMADREQSGLPPTLREFGSSGLRRAGGIVNEEFLHDLAGTRGVQVYREMETDPVASGMIFALSRLLARLDWKIEAPETAGPDEILATEFVESCFTDMEIPWSNILDDILSVITYGWSLLEVNYKLRQGPDAAEDWQRSAFTDGKLGWRSMRIRAQETLTRWIFDDAGNLLGMEQLDPNAGGHGIRPIPLAKALLFRTTTVKDNPEGKSLLRGAYRPWFFKKRIEEYEAMGVERDLAGLPVARIPAAYFSPSASIDEKATLRTMQELVAGIRNDTEGGLVLPVAWDDKGNKLIDFELMASAGSKQIDTNEIVKRKSSEMAMSILMDFLMLGHEGVGSFALGAARIDLWTMSVSALAEGIASTFNEYAIKPLLRANRISAAEPPRLTYGDVATVDLEVLGNFVGKMVDAGLLTPDPEVERVIRDAANLPPLPEQHGVGYEAQ